MKLSLLYHSGNFNNIINNIIKVVDIDIVNNIIELWTEEFTGIEKIIPFFKYNTIICENDLNRFELKNLKLQECKIRNSDNENYIYFKLESVEVI